MTEPQAESVSSFELVRRPDDHAEFRLAQLLLLLETSVALGAKLDLERLGVFDFLAANPFLVVSENDSHFNRLRLAGFGSHSLTYAAPGHRFATRRGRLQHDISLLVAYGLAEVVVDDGRRRYVLTDIGVSAADSLTSTYADAYRLSASEMLRRVRNLSDRSLRDRLRGWLQADPILYEVLWSEPPPPRPTDIGSDS
ncbi:ABC-three component system middle component 2 [Pseudonocardia saturnea]